MATVKSKAQQAELNSYLEEFIVENSLTGVKEISAFWLGIYRENPKSSSWNWYIGNKKCPINKFGPRFFAEPTPNSFGGSARINCAYITVYDTRIADDKTWFFGRCDINIGNFGYICQEKITGCNAQATLAKPTAKPTVKPAKAPRPNSVIPTYLQLTLLILAGLLI